MKDFLNGIRYLLVVLGLLAVGVFVSSQTTNTFPALQHFLGIPTNPCQKTFLAQNDATDQFYTCDVNSLQWALISGATQINGTLSPGYGLPARFVFVSADAGGFTQAGNPNAVHCTGTQTGIQPTATEAAGIQEAGNGGASTSVVGGCTQNEGAGLNSSGYTFGTMARYAARFKPGNTATVRYWVGLGDLNALADLSTSTYASDAPPRFYCAFRDSVGVDTNWQAICATDATHQTIVDTGIAPQTTNSVLFEILPNAAMTSVQFAINGVSVATITTNLPTSAQRPCPLWTVDNKNNAVTDSGILYWSQVLYSK